MTSNSAIFTPWSLPYAPHLGYRAGTRPLFQYSVASDDSSAHIKYAHSLGFSGILHPWIVDRGDIEIEAVGRLLRSLGMRCGCVVFAPAQAALKPLWVVDDGAEELFGHVTRAIEIARRLHATVVAVLIKADPDMAVEKQFNNTVANLKKAADLAARAGITLGIEPLPVVPQMLVNDYFVARRLVARVAHPAVQLIFDTGHAYLHCDSVPELFSELYEDICLLQLADQPGRVEPGIGKIDFVDLLSRAIKHGYMGLVELEYSWSKTGVEGEAAGLACLLSIDAAANRKAHS